MLAKRGVVAEIAHVSSVIEAAVLDALRLLVVDDDVPPFVDAFDAASEELALPTANARKQLLAKIRIRRSRSTITADLPRLFGE